MPQYAYCESAGNAKSFWHIRRLVDDKGKNRLGVFQLDTHPLCGGLAEWDIVDDPPVFNAYPFVCRKCVAIYERLVR